MCLTRTLSGSFVVAIFLALAAANAAAQTYYVQSAEWGYLLHATERNRLWFDQGCKRGRIYLHSLLGQAIEQFAARGRRTTVESKGELVEIIIQVMVSDRTLMDRFSSEITRCTRGNNSEGDFCCPRRNVT